jgi:hypothetical protein
MIWKMSQERKRREFSALVSGTHFAACDQQLLPTPHLNPIHELFSKQTFRQGINFDVSLSRKNEGT